MNLVKMSALVWPLVILSSQAAIAQNNEVSIGFAKPREVNPNEPRWVVCTTTDNVTKKKYIGEIKTTTAGALTGKSENGWRPHLIRNYDLSDDLYGGCNVEDSAEDAQWRHQVFVDSANQPKFKREIVYVTWQLALSGAKPTTAVRRPGKAAGLNEVAAKAPSPSKYVEVEGPNGTIRLSPEVAARNQAAAENYRREVEAHERAKADATAAHERKLAEHQENAAKASAAKQAHEQKLAANAAEVAAHKAAMDDYKKKLAGEASTDDDPNRCITSPAIKAGLRGNTEVHVTNGCDQKVDIVICLKRTSGDWLCGARFGILSQRSMSFMSKNATGEIYVDAVTFGSRNKLGRPAGIIK